RAARPSGSATCAPRAKVSYASDAGPRASPRPRSPRTKRSRSCVTTSRNGRGRSVRSSTASAPRPPTTSCAGSDPTIRSSGSARGSRAGSRHDQPVGDIYEANADDGGEEASDDVERIVDPVVDPGEADPQGAHEQQRTPPPREE